MKTVLVTGSTDGIGFETARQLLVEGMHVLVHGRNEKKATRSAAELARRVPGSRTTAVWGDFSRMSEVAELASQVNAVAPVLDVLINNAGIYSRRRIMTDDGLELTMAVNHFAPYLLTRLIGPLLSKAPAGRIVNVSSMAHQSGEIDLDDLTFEHGFDGYGAYSASKLVNILFTRALANRLAGTGVTANCLHPGVIDTKLLHAGFDIKGESVQSGAETSVYLATSEKVANVSGKYFVNCRETSPSRRARDARLAEALWSQSEKLVGEYL
ncbi:MAG: SDR family oxidoreductase [Burkholderiales bacterium]|jgi:NAD(P)-dependent dehydrogenase (short-subunit alcohol dehydrogenase family)